MCVYTEALMELYVCAKCCYPKKIKALLTHLLIKERNKTLQT